MSYQLSRVRLANIGDRAARFPDTTIELAAPAADGGSPLDSILWLRNGGGKSSLLSLFFALVLPLRRDFLGVSVKRHLEDYIATGDTSHAIAEWVDVRTDALFGAGTQLVTGAVYEWDERRKPVDPDRNRDKLKVNYYAFTATPGLLTLDTLPVTDDAGRPVDRATYIRRLRELAAEHPQALQLTVTDSPVSWMTTLGERHLDPALFRYQKRMNHSEGGVAELFNFDTPAKFIDLLIDLTVEPVQPERVAGNLRAVADILAAKPQRQLEARFCDVLAGKLDALAGEHAAAGVAAAAAAAAAGEASGLAASLQAAAAVHTTRQEQLLASLEGIAAQQADAVRERDRDRVRANELLLRAERFRESTAAELLAKRRTAETGARAAVAAWQATEPLAELADAREQIADLNRQQAAEEQRNAPLRERHDDAALALLTRYTTLEATERAQATRAAGRATAATAEAGRLRAAQRDAEQTRAAARAQRERAEQDIDAVTRAIAGAVAAGDLPDADTDPAGHAEHVTAERASTAERLAAVRAARRARLREREELSRRRTTKTGERSRRDGERTATVDERDKLAGRAAMLAASGRLHELLQLDADTAVDLWADPVGLRTALARAAADADTAIVAARVDAAEDLRALDALTGTGFLPTTRDAQRVADALTAAGVLARPGWELLRDVIDTPHRAEALRSPLLGALASGVVVADTALDDARRALETGGLTAIAHVPVASAADLEAAVRAAPAAWAVTAPTPALFDPAAADTDRTDRERHQAIREAEITGWAAQARADRALLADLDTFYTDCPAGHLDALEADIAAATADIDALDAELGDLQRQAEALEQAEAADADTETALAEQVAAQAEQLVRLQALAGQVAGLPGLRELFAELTDSIADLNTEVDELDTAAAEQETLRERATTEAADRKAAADRHAADRAEIRLLGDTPAAARAAVGDVADDDQAPLTTLQSRYSTASRDWLVVAAQSVLAERLRTQTARAAAAEGKLAGVPADARAAAEQLLTTVEGQDERSRWAALEQARTYLEDALVGVSRAGEELRAARETVRAAERVRESRRAAADLETEPVDEADARAQAEQYAAASTAASELATTLARQHEDAQRHAADAKSAADLFGQQVARLRDAVRQAMPSTAGAPVPPGADDDREPPAAAPFDGSAADADGRVTAAVAALAAAVEVARTSAGRVERAVSAVRRAATEFTTISDPIKERLTGDDPERLVALAATRADDLRARRQQILGLLEEIRRDQGVVVTQVAALVTDVLGTLTAAQRHSRLPGFLGDWSDQQFLTIRFTKPGSDEDLKVRIASVIDEVVREGSKPEGLALLKRCVHEAVAPRGFKVTVLKPNSDLAVEPLDITLLGKYSGGEKLTVCVALYCTLARLRAVNRGLGHVGGTLVLDNPLGTASHVKLLRLQREVAAAHGVQLVYTTGVEDVGAVGQFPNVVRLRNSPGTLRQRRYVTVESRTGTAYDDDGDDISGITNVRVARDEGTAAS
ncbi:hypothetical protein [Geodermatophilus sp. SYSU D00710]